MNYTQKEIQAKIDVLTNKIDKEKRKRTEITVNINNMNKDLKSWLEFDMSQCKLS